MKTICDGLNLDLQVTILFKSTFKIVYISNVIRVKQIKLDLNTSVNKVTHTQNSLYS